MPARRRTGRPAKRFIQASVAASALPSGAGGSPPASRSRCASTSAAALALTGPLTWHDVRAGTVAGRPELLGDVVLARKDVPTSYHLAVTVDDALQGVTLVTRGEDLFHATHVHRLLQALLGFAAPRYYHHNLIADSTGLRLAKRNRAVTLRTLRQSGRRPDDIWRLIGLPDPMPASRGGMRAAACAALAGGRSRPARLRAERAAPPAEPHDLPRRDWLPDDTPPRAVILAVHGFNDYSNAFDDVRHLSPPSAASPSTPTTRGASAPTPMPAAGRASRRWSTTWCASASGSATLYPDTPVYLLGESMGAAVLIAAAARGRAARVTTASSCRRPRSGAATS